MAEDVIRYVGNYGEIYDRHLGPVGSNIPREGTRNALWSSAPCANCPKGGQIYAAPVRADCRSVGVDKLITNDAYNGARARTCGHIL